VRRSRQQQLRGWAGELGLAVSGGSDCHGAGRREIGCCTISTEELDRLRQQCQAGRAEVPFAEQHLRE
jgi:hypothetical protein